MLDAERLASSDDPVTPLVPGRRRGLVSSSDDDDGGDSGKSGGGGSTLFERMARLSRGSEASESPGDDDGDDSGSINIPRFLGRQNNQ